MFISPVPATKSLTEKSGFFVSQVVYALREATLTDERNNFWFSWVKVDIPEQAVTSVQECLCVVNVPWLAGLTFWMLIS